MKILDERAGRPSAGGDEALTSKAGESRTAPREIEDGPPHRTPSTWDSVETIVWEEV